MANWLTIGSNCTCNYSYGLHGWKFPSLLLKQLATYNTMGWINFINGSYNMHKFFTYYIYSYVNKIDNNYKCT